ncbi:MAG TPA: MGMT family protein [Candidatus Saccharimonadales bacterium]|nr:MGMT family protein [Candidatus Saccharimonadales bacterium]
MNNPKPFVRIYELVAQIPKGKVATYGQVARIAGVNPRVVGFAMNGNKDMKRVPCHRVVSTDGSLRGYALGLDLKHQKLVEEGVSFLPNGYVDLEKSLYTF